MRLFQRILLIDSCFACLLVGGWLVEPHMHPAAIAAVVAVLCAFSLGSGVLLYEARHHPFVSRQSRRRLADVGHLAEFLPGLALLGTAAGFRLALGGDVSDIQHRIGGAATGITATFVGIACWLVLSAQHRLVVREHETP